jgi:hypothetical protein
LIFDFIGAYMMADNKYLMVCYYYIYALRIADNNSK